MILSQDDVYETTRIFQAVFADAELVHSRIVESGVRIRVVYEDSDRNLTLVIDEQVIRDVETQEEWRQLCADTARDFRFRVALAKVLATCPAA